MKMKTVRRDAKGLRAEVRAGPTLTAREREVLQLEAQGLSYKLIAAQLDLSESTVRNHLYAARRKLGVHSALEAINRVWPRGEAPPQRQSA